MRDSSIIRVSTWTSKFQDFYLLRKSYFRTERVLTYVVNIEIQILSRQIKCRVEFFKKYLMCKLVLEEEGVFLDKTSEKLRTIKI